MAYPESGSTSVRVTAYDTLKFSWKESSRDPNNNQTTVQWTLQLISVKYGTIYSTQAREWSVNVNGTKKSGKVSVAIGDNETKTLASDSTTITHNNDGKKTFNYSFSQDFQITFSGSKVELISGSGSGTLTTQDLAAPNISVWVTKQIGSTTRESRWHHGFNIAARSDNPCDEWWYSLDGGAYTSFSTTQTCDVSQWIYATPKEHTVKVRGRRSWNNKEGTSSALSVSTTLPDITGTVNVTGSNSFTIDLKSDYTVDIWEYSFDNNTFTQWSNKDSKSETYKYTSATHKDYVTVYIKGCRSLSALYYTKSWTIDLTLPTLGIVSQKMISTNTLLLNYTCNYDHEYQFNNGSWISNNVGTNAISVTVDNDSESNYVFKVRRKGSPNLITTKVISIDSRFPRMSNVIVVPQCSGKDITYYTDIISTTSKFNCISNVYNYMDIEYMVSNDTITTSWKSFTSDDTETMCYGEFPTINNTNSEYMLTVRHKDNTALTTTYTINSNNIVPSFIVDSNTALADTLKISAHETHDIACSNWVITLVPNDGSDILRYIYNVTTNNIDNLTIRGLTINTEYEIIIYATNPINNIKGGTKLNNVKSPGAAKVFYNNNFNNYACPFVYNEGKWHSAIPYVYYEGKWYLCT